MFIQKSKNIVDLNRFNDEVKELNSKITLVLLFGDSNLRFTLSEALTTEEDAALDVFISSFVDSDPVNATPLLLTLAKAEAKNKHFHNIDYKKEIVGALIPERESHTIKGEVRQVTWYRDLIDGVPDKPVIRTDIQYFRDASGFAMYRTSARTYFNIDGTENPDVKVTVKYYFINKQDMVDEGIKRRTLLVKSIQIPTMQLIAEVLMPLGVTMANVVLKGRKFMDDYEDYFNKFKHNSSSVTDPLEEDFGMKNVIVKLRDEDDPDHVSWLDMLPNSLGGSTSIRQHLIGEFTI